MKQLWEVPSVAMVLYLVKDTLRLKSFSMNDLEVRILNVYAVVCIVDAVWAFDALQEALVNIQSSDIMDELFTKLLLSRTQNKKLLKA